MLVNFFKKNWFLIIVFLVTFFIRTILLDRFPIGITHDELNYIFAAKSLFWTHAFPPGTAPALLPAGMNNFTVSVAEVPVIFLVPIAGFFQTTLLTSRMLGGLLSVLSALAIYFLVKDLTKSIVYARLCFLLTAINPWSFLMGRTIFEVNFFVCFFLWGFIILLKNESWKILYALPFYVLGFLSYTGGQISFYLFSLITLTYHYSLSRQKQKLRRVYILFVISMTICLTFYLFTVTSNQSFIARGSEIYLPNHAVVSEGVNFERKLMVPSPLNNLFVNKATVYFNGFMNRYLNAFSVNNLFLTGETRAAFSYQKHGTFYLIDFPFMIMGLAFLYARNRREWLFIVAVVVSCSLTSGLSIIEFSYSQRSGLIYPFLIILSGIGIGGIYKVHISKWKKMTLLFLIGFIYLISFVNLLHIYFYRFPVYASDGWFFQDRILSRYIYLTQQSYSETKVIVFTPEPKIIFQEYLFYTGGYAGADVELINSRMDKKIYSLGNISFTSLCPDMDTKGSAVLIFDGRIECEHKLSAENPVRITRFVDVYENYLILGDRLCQNLALGRYILGSAYTDFSIEKQYENEFCKRWITRL